MRESCKWNILMNKMLLQLSIKYYLRYAICIRKILYIGKYPSLIHSLEVILYILVFNKYRDIKPENILLEKEDPDNLNIKLTDFGFACFYKPGEYQKEVLGSPLYMAPEIINEEFYD